MNLARQGFEYFLPVFRTDSVSQGRKTTRHHVLFPSYIFVLVPEAPDAWRALHGTYGARHIVMGAGGFHVVSLVVIEAMRSTLDAEGYVVLPEKLLPEPEVLHIGDHVEVSGYGSFGRTIPGVYQGISGPNRVKILLDHLGIATVDREYVAKAA